MHHIMRLVFSLSFILFSILLMGQDTREIEAKKFAENYARNIKKSRINGIYIPRNISDAITQLKRKSDAQGLSDFKEAEEDLVAKKLHFGLGRWMIINWNLEYGSRLSYQLTEMGLKHPDDMAQLLMRCFHRHLNEKPLKEKEIVEMLLKKRAKEKQERLKGNVIKTLSTKKIPKEKG